MDTPYSYGLSRYAGIVVNNSRRVSYDDDDLTFVAVTYCLLTQPLMHIYCTGISPPIS